MLSLKISTGKISSILIDERTTLQNALNNAMEQTAEIAEKKKNITKIEDSRLGIYFYYYFLYILEKYV